MLNKAASSQEGIGNLWECRWLSSLLFHQQEWSKGLLCHTHIEENACYQREDKVNNKTSRGKWEDYVKKMFDSHQ